MSSQYDKYIQDHLDVCLDTELNARSITSGTFLDIGTYDGSQAHFLSKKGFTVTATDKHRKYLYRAIQNYPNVNFIHDDMCNTKITDTFDYVLDRGCYHQQESDNQKTYIENLHKLCDKLLFLKIITDTSLPQHKDMEHIKTNFGNYFNILSVTNTTWSPTATGLSQFLVMEPK